MPNKKHPVLISTLLPVIFFLGGCSNFGGGSTPAVTTDNLHKIYETGEYAVTIPKTWEVIEKKDFTSEIPPETEIVFRNNVKNETFTANTNILKNKLLNTVSTADYSKLVNNRQKYGLIDYKEIKNDPYKIKIAGKDTDTFLREFDAKKSVADNTVRYFQTYAVKNNNAFIITGSLSPNEDQNTAKSIEDIVKSFIIK